MRLYRLFLYSVPLASSFFGMQSLWALDAAEKALQYRGVVQELERIILRELEDKGIPAISIALVDDQDVIWARGFGKAREGHRATSGTVYRVGSVSKLFNAMAVMRLVERGILNLDAPVTTYLPGFQIADPESHPITLRQLLSHRAGIVRESPVGSYFDPSEPSLEASVMSLRGTPRIYPASTRMKYSNAGVSLAGFIVEKVSKEAYPEFVQREILDSMGLTSSSFVANEGVRAALADAYMWTYAGRTFLAPKFRFGILPAGNLYSTVNDLGRFMSVLFRDGQIRGGRILATATLEEMFRPQFVPEGTKRGFGLGFHISEFEGERRVGHSGAVYGFSTQLAALTDSKVGVAVVGSLDVTNAVIGRIADHALRCMLALRRGESLPRMEFGEPVPAELARKLAGLYGRGGAVIELREREGRLEVRWRGLRAAVKQLGSALVVDGRVLSGQVIRVTDKGVALDGIQHDRLTRAEEPVAVRSAWKSLIGEYGWDHNTLFILEKRGRLYALIEWIFEYPLRQLSENVYAFPDYGLYHGEELYFRRGTDGVVESVEAAGVMFARRFGEREAGQTFKIRPLRAAHDLRKDALAATPPLEEGDFLRPDLVDLRQFGGGLKFDIRYAGTNNFLSLALYRKPMAYLQRPAAEALVRVHRRLEQAGYGLLIFDAYRPWHVTKMFWDALPDSMRHFVANPSKGSRHNRGAAVDLTMYNLETGEPAAMGGEYDEFTIRSYAHYPGGTSLQRWRRRLLRDAMKAEGLSGSTLEWWHFNHRDWSRYSIMNKSFDELE